MAPVTRRVWRTSCMCMGWWSPARNNVPSGAEDYGHGRGSYYELRHMGVGHGILLATRHLFAATPCRHDGDWFFRELGDAHALVVGSYRYSHFGGHAAVLCCG
ncbi:protein of unknown function [Acidithiobacillus ferrivorans]|uniref:Uncharacterized protein n=1 Tax=Acidithiobacillus ferrivorans TaxID=160808 RepID=A0A060UVN4_9PROT|nr:hypothetical protein AFERRI_400395 [Acidithiobacillus ferrivorans]SMH64644.1 protein of unknown function [Acidithiobacillus ferrivorans]